MIRIIRRIIIAIIVFCFFGWLLCDIDPNKEYTWYHGIWHGLFFIINLVRSLFTGALYKAEIYTTSYNVFYWIFCTLQVLGILFNGIGNSRRKY